MNYRAVILLVLLSFALAGLSWGGVPTIDAIAPHDRESLVPVNSPVEITFSEAIDLSIVGGTPFVLDPPTPLNTSVSGQKVTAFPKSGSFAKYQRYVVNFFKSEIKSISTSQNPDSDYNWSFTTAFAATPEQDSVGVPVSTPISATFIDSMDVNTIGGSLNHQGTPVDGGVTYDVGSKTETFTPAQSLGPGKTYTIYLKNPDGTSVFWDFTTVPRLTVTAPADGLVTTNGVLPVSGSAGSDLGIKSVTVNGSANLLQPGGTFNSNINLSPGKNVITITAQDNGWGTVPDSRTIYYDTDSAPRIYLASPADGSRLRTSPITISGYVDDVTLPDHISINGTNVFLDQDFGTFQYQIPLNRGSNSIALAATDLAGNTQNKNISYFYDPDPPVISAVSPTASKNSSVTITGTVSDSSQIASVTVNGHTAQLSGGTFSYPATLQPGANPFTITATDVLGNAGSKTVSIYYDRTSPTISVTSPPLISDSLITTSSTITIKGTVADNVQAASLTINGNSVALVSGSFSYSASLSSGSNSFDLVAMDSAGNSSTKTITVTRVITPVGPPAVLFTSPVDSSSSISLGTTIDITFSQPMDPSTLIGANFHLTPTTSVDIQYLPSSTPIVKLKPSPTLLPNTTYTVTVDNTVKNIAGTPLATYTWAFTTTTSDYPPLAVTTSPVDQAIVPSTISSVMARFNQPMDVSTINGTNFTVYQGSSKVTGIVTYDSAANAAIFTPSSPFTSGLTYSGTISTSVKGVTGRQLSSPYSWNFSTVDPQLSVSSKNPAPNSTGVSIGTKITAFFNAPLDSSTVTTSNFNVFEGSTQIAGAVTYDALSKAAIFTPQTALKLGTTYTAVVGTGVKSNTTPSTALASAATWSFTTSPSVGVDFKNPASGATAVPITTTVTAHFNQPMVTSSITNATFIVSEGSTPITGRVDTTSTTAVFTPGSALKPGTTYTVTIKAGVKGASGTTLSAPYTWSFTTAPFVQVTSTMPAANASAVSTAAQITVTFNQPINTSTITGATFSISDGTAKISGTLATNSTTAVFTPASPLKPGTRYTATISNGVKGVSGTTMPVPYTWSFTTSPNVAVVATTPAPNAVSVPVTTTVSARFNQSMDISTINGSTFTLSNGSAFVSGKVVYDATSKTATLTPNASLKTGTIYTASVSTLARSVTGNLLPTPYTWSFTTIPDAAIAVTSTDPAKNATAVPVGTKITAIFNQPLDSSTLTTSSFTVSNGSSNVTGKVEYDPTSNAAVFIPDIPLKPGTVYTASINTAVKSSSGKSLSSPYSWDFTTAEFSVKVSTVPDKSTSNKDVVNIAGIVELKGGLKSLVVNGYEVAPNSDGTFSITLILAPGPNTITITATDNAGGIVTETRTVTYDKSFPAVSISYPPDNISTNQSFVEVTGIADSAYRVFLKDNSGSTSETSRDGTAFSATANLEPGLNTLQILAVDAANRTTTLKRTIIYDAAVPGLAVTTPAEDIRTSEKSIILKGVVVEAAPPTLLTLSIDGVPVDPAPVVANGAFEQTLSFTTEKTYTIAVTATDPQGNKATVQRNIMYVRYDLGDAQKAMRIAVGLTDSTPALVAQYDVAPFRNGQPVPDGKIDILDVVVILKRIVGLLTW